MAAVTPEVYCIFCRAKLNYYYGWYCPVRYFSLVV